MVSPTTWPQPGVVIPIWLFSQIRITLADILGITFYEHVCVLALWASSVTKLLAKIETGMAAPIPTSRFSLVTFIP